ncbi:MAG: hypothetical protein EOP85_00020 [Verrucomicrobiaceae bacterium]|nr:MAG: hypothetical protein EOP85_00020 [Verrucomicrobiaceae bacterium]
MISISAAEIVAWKVPLDRYSFRPGERLASPPEASPFFSPGDELRDAGKPDDKNAPKLEWAVWNETTGTLVTKGSLGTMWPLRILLAPYDVPHQCRVRLDLFDTTEDEPLDKDAKPAATVEWIAKSGGKSHAMTAAGGRRIEVEADVMLDDARTMVNLRLEGIFQIPHQDRMKIKTVFNMKSGSSVWVAGDRSNRKGMEVRATATAVLMDGTPRTEAVRIQIDDQAVPISQPRRSLEKHRIDGKAWLFLAATELTDFFPGETVENQDPFAETVTEPGPPTKLEQLKTVAAPEALAKWFKGPVLDLRETIASTGIELTEGVDFAGYDVIAQSAVFLTTSDSEAEKLEQMLLSGSDRWPNPASVSCEDGGRIHVTSGSSQPAFVARGSDDENPVRRFDVEPIIGESGILQLNFRYQDNSSRASTVLVDSTVTVKNGEPVEIFRDGSETPVKLTGLIVEP